MSKPRTVGKHPALAAPYGGQRPNKLLQQVARAICVAEKGNPDGAHKITSGPLVHWKGKQWELYIDTARAAITAMRDLPPEMIVAGESAMFEWREKPEGWTLKMFADGWRNAIDEALKP